MSLAAGAGADAGVYPPPDSLPPAASTHPTPPNHPEGGTPMPRNFPKPPAPHPPEITVNDVVTMIEDAIINGNTPPADVNDCDQDDDEAFAVIDSSPITADSSEVVLHCEKRVVVTKKYKVTVNIEPVPTSE